MPSRVGRVACAASQETWWSSSPAHRREFSCRVFASAMASAAESQANVEARQGYPYSTASVCGCGTGTMMSSCVFPSESRSAWMLLVLGVPKGSGGTSSVGAGCVVI